MSVKGLNVGMFPSDPTSCVQAQQHWSPSRLHAFLKSVASCVETVLVRSRRCRDSEELELLLMQQSDTLFPESSGGLFCSDIR